MTETAAEFETMAELPAGVRLRHLDPASDYPAMNAIANQIRRTTGQAFFTSDEDFARYYDAARGFDRERDVLVVEQDGAVAGYARAGVREEPQGPRILEVMSFVDPLKIGDAAFVAAIQAIEARLAEIAAALPPGERVFETFGGDDAPERDALLRSIGYEPVRWFFTMIRPTLDPLPDSPLPDGLEIRPVEPSHMRAIWEADQEAFRDHWGFTTGGDNDFAAFQAVADEQDPTIWQIAWDGDQVAGQVRGFIAKAENEAFGIRRGYVESISVRRPWRRRGLARALIAATIDVLRERGMTEGMLGVDTENLSGALRLYEACGFERRRRATTYRKPLG